MYLIYESKRDITHCLGKFYYVHYIGGIGLNGNKLKCIIGTHGN